MALSDGQKAINEVVAAFNAANSEVLQIPSLLNAAKEMLKLYDLMFPSKGKVYDILKGDHVGHVNALEKAFEADKAHPKHDDSVFGLIVREIEGTSRDKVRNNIHSGTCSVLWIMRTIAFLTRFLDTLSDAKLKDKEAYDCAREAYKEVLYPYHRMVVSVVVRLALGA